MIIADTTKIPRKFDNTLIGKIVLKGVSAPAAKFFDPFVVTGGTISTLFGSYLELSDNGEHPIVAETQGSDSTDTFPALSIMCICDSVEEVNLILETSHHHELQVSEVIAEQWQTLFDLDGHEISPELKV